MTLARLSPAMRTAAFQNLLLELLDSSRVSKSAYPITPQLVWPAFLAPTLFAMLNRLSSLSSTPLISPTTHPGNWHVRCYKNSHSDIMLI